MNVDEAMMRIALAEAQLALTDGHLPVGAVLALGEAVLGRGRKSITSNHLDHAEMIAFRRVFSGDYGFSRNDPITLYTTLEPCIMCWGTMRHLPIQRLVYAMSDAYGGCASAELQPNPPRHVARPIEIVSGLLKEDARHLFEEFLNTTTEPFWVNGGAAEFVAEVRRI